MKSISVIMPVYNGEKYLKLAIDSILNQSFKDFEFIIFNDGSIDSTEQIIKSYDDPRIVYIKNEKNLGLSKSFNIGIRASQGQFIARMDADDISVHDRFQKQLTFLQIHNDVDIVGGSVVLIDEDGKKLKNIRRPTHHINIKWQSLFSTPLFHPTVFARANILKNNRYDESLPNSEDYELWSRLLFTTNTHFANIYEPLLFYRTSGFTFKLQNDKRINSAQNSINNIERYIQLESHEKNVLTLLRQDKSLTTKELWIIWKLYQSAARSFCRKENVKFPENLRIYSKLISLKIFLLKHKIKHLE